MTNVDDNFLIIIIALAAISFFLWGYTTGTSAYKQNISENDLQLIKEDAYTRGHIDGRASRLEEESAGNYSSCRLGVQEENVSSPYPGWRQYANVISRTNWTLHERCS